ncbi:phage protein NinX family protein [Paraburkholderia phenoliruptrix]|uniref:phage protein NinX family protein n=1 Tax=Paraburkholderia phenoliruptrix TaxID=252970 RepID=UPI0034CDFBA4
MKQFTELTGAELDIAVALALGASKTKTAMDNAIACGVPLRYREPMFAVVNAAGIAVMWRPTVDWYQGGPLLTNLLELGFMIMQPPEMPVAVIKEAWRIEGADVLEAVCRTVVAMAQTKESA